MNFNSLVTLNSYAQFTEINANVIISNFRTIPSEILIAFFVNSPYKYYYYNFYSIKFTGNAESITKISLIRSTRKNDTLPYNVKNNYSVNELDAINYSMEYNRKYNIKITYKEKQLRLFIDKTLVLSYDLEIDTTGGHFAIANRNAGIQVDKISFYDRKDLLFEDDFNTNTIKVNTVRAIKTSNPK